MVVVGYGVVGYGVDSVGNGVVVAGVVHVSDAKTPQVLPMQTVSENPNSPLLPTNLPLTKTL